MDELKNSEWTEKERGFERERERLARSVDMFQLMDDPFLLMKRQKLTGYLTRIKLFEMILNIKGSIVECGVHKGGSLMLYYHLSSILEPTAFNRKVFGFDSFEGFRSISEKDDEVLDDTMFSNTSYELLQQVVALHDQNRPISHVAKCELIKGDATKTIPQFVEERPELVIALLYLDFDLYEPTKVAMEKLLPLVPKGGVVAFDELNSQKWAGETRAFKEVLRLNDIALKKFPFDPWPSYFVVGEK